MRFINIRSLSAVGACALVLTGAAACSAGQGSHGPLEATSITVADFPSVDSAGLYIADQLGLFKQQGLNVNIVPVFTTSQDTVNDIDGNLEKEPAKPTSANAPSYVPAQISSGDYVTYMDDELESGIHLEIVGEASILQPNALALFVKDGSKINSLSQLEGQKVSVAGKDDIASLLIDSLLSDNGIPSSKVTLVPGTPLPADPALLNQGAFTAAPIPEPFVSEGEQEFGLQELADLDQGGTEDFPIQGFAVTQAWAQQNPNTLKAFTIALDEGQQIADTDRDAVEKAIEQPPLSVKPSIASVISLPEFPTGIDPVRLQRVVNDMIQFGFIPKSDASFQVSSISYSGNLASTTGGSANMTGMTAAG